MVEMRFVHVASWSRLRERGLWGCRLVVSCVLPPDEALRLLGASRVRHTDPEVVRCRRAAREGLVGRMKEKGVDYSTFPLHRW